MLSVLTSIFLFIHYPHHCPSKILWTCYIVAEYHTPTSFLLSSAILKIDIASIRIAICVPRVLRYLMIIKNCSPLQFYSTVNCYPQKYFLNFPMGNLTSAASPTRLCLEFSSGDAVDIEMKEIGCRQIPSRELSNSNFPPSLCCDSEFIYSIESSDYRNTAPVISLDQYILM